MKLRQVFAPLAFLALFASHTAAQDTTRARQDDGWPDMSSFLDKPFGFLPILIPITEPALGYGAAGGLVFIDKRRDGKVDMRHPTMTGVFGFATEDGSWGVAAGHSGYKLDNRLRWRTFGIYTELDLEFYGFRDDSPLRDTPVNYLLTTAGGLLGGQYRLGESGFYAGVDYLIAGFEVNAELPDPVPPEVGAFESTSRLAALRPSVTYDSRNNVFTALSGLYADLSASWFNQVVGSEIEYTTANLIVLGYAPLVRNLFLGVKGEGTLSSGDAPFYLQPWVTLRGLAAQRRQGQQVADSEIELRWQFWNRISALGFVGAGAAWSGTEGSDEVSSVVTGGGGIRYEIARKYGIHMGLDVGFGPDEPILYVQFGSAWARP